MQENEMESLMCNDQSKHPSFNDVWESDSVLQMKFLAYLLKYSEGFRTNLKNVKKKVWIKCEISI